MHLSNVEIFGAVGVNEPNIASDRDVPNNFQFARGIRRTDAYIARDRLEDHRRTTANEAIGDQDDVAIHTLYDASRISSVTISQRQEWLESDDSQAVLAVNRYWTIKCLCHISFFLSVQLLYCVGFPAELKFFMMKRLQEKLIWHCWFGPKDEAMRSHWVMIVPLHSLPGMNLNLVDYEAHYRQRPGSSHRGRDFFKPMVSWCALMSGATHDQG
jgi:hypothetical protein